MFQSGFEGDKTLLVGDAIFQPDDLTLPISNLAGGIGMRLFGCLLVTIGSTGIMVAQPRPAGSLGRADLSAWLDGYFHRSLNEASIAGAVVVVVDSGRVLIEKGFGFADVARRIPVDPE